MDYRHVIKDTAIINVPSMDKILFNGTFIVTKTKSGLYHFWVGNDKNANACEIDDARLELIINKLVAARHNKEA